MSPSRPEKPERLLRKRYWTHSPSLSHLSSCDLPREQASEYWAKDGVSHAHWPCLKEGLWRNETVCVFASQFPKLRIERRGYVVVPVSKRGVGMISITYALQPGFRIASDGVPSLTRRVHGHGASSSPADLRKLFQAAWCPDRLFSNDIFDK